MKMTTIAQAAADTWTTTTTKSEERKPETEERDARGVKITPIMRAAMEIKF